MNSVSYGANLALARKLNNSNDNISINKWKPEPDWYDIESILNNDTTECYAKAIALLRDDVESGLIYNQIRGAEHYNINGEISIEANPDEVVVIKDYLKNIQGKPCSEGYNTKYIIYYIDRPQTPIMIPNSAIYFIIKDCDATNQNAFSGKEIKAIKFINSKILNANFLQGLFQFNHQLQSIEGLEIKNRYTEVGTFRDCYSLETISQFDTSNVTSMNTMFYKCYSLRNIPQFDTSNVTSMVNMFCDCRLLKAIPQLNTNKVTNMNNMFSNCYSLETIPELDTSNVTSMYYTFSNCNSLKNIPQLNTNKVTNMNNMFSGCHLLKNISKLNTNNVTDMNWMFSGCSSLETISELDMNKVTDASNMFYQCYSLISIGKISNISCNLKINDSGYLNHETLIRILNALVTNTTTKTLTLGSTNLSKLTDEEKVIATEKGWTLA